MRNPEPLQRLADGFASVAARDYSDIAVACHSMAINTLDMRYIVIEDCLGLTACAWGDPPDPQLGVTRAFRDRLADIWSSLRQILDEPDIEVAVRLGCHMYDELKVLLASQDPMTYRDPC